MLIPKLELNLYTDKELAIIGMLGNKRYHRNFDPNRFYELSATRLKSVIGSDYKAVIQGLIERGIIECDNSYQTGLKCKGYRLTALATEIWHPTGKLAERIKADREAHDEPVDPLFKRMKRDLGHFKLDYNAAMERAYDFQREEDEFTADGVINSAAKQDAHFEQASFYCFGDTFLVRDEFGRVHTPISGLWTGFRELLTLDGEETVNIDITNSQAHLVCDTLLRVARGEMIEKLATLMGRLATRGENKLSLHNTTHASIYRQSKELMADLHILCLANIAELRQIARIAREGRFFEEMMHRTGFKGTRKEFKAAFWKIFFGRGEHLTPKEHEAFQAMGALGQALRLMKTIHYAVVPKIFQALEAEIFYESGLIDSLHKDRIKVATIHDSMVCKKSHAQEVASRIRKAYAKTGHAVPTIKIEENTVNCYERVHEEGNLYQTEEGWQSTSTEDGWQQTSVEGQPRLVYVAGNCPITGRWPERTDSERESAMIYAQQLSWWEWKPPD